MRAVLDAIGTVAPTGSTVLVLGETGTGKEVVAQAIHEASPRANKPFVVIDCGAIPPALAESTLFGHERGAFTGAVAKRLSPFVEAQGGTLFLDELGELPLEMQPKLLRVLAERRIKSVGANAYTDVDVRVLAATRRDLLKEVNDGSFCSDLYFRIGQARVELPPLRERLDDVPALIEHLMTRARKADAFRRLTPTSIDRAQRYDWPGNVRELSNVVALALAYGEKGPVDLAPHISEMHRLGSTGTLSEARTFAQAKSELERTYFEALFKEYHGNISEIARRAEVDRKTVRDCLRRHKITS